MKPSMLAAILLAGVAVAAAGQPKYGVKVDVDRKADFTKLKTYTWSTRYSAPDKSVHAWIVAAVERQLAAVGLVKQVEGPSDVIVVYDAQRQTDVDLEAPAQEHGAQPTYTVGLLVVRLLDPASGQALLQGRLLRPISADREKLPGEIDAAVTDIFSKYPRRAGSGS
jgi:hypothetical protein